MHTGDLRILDALRLVCAFCLESKALVADADDDALCLGFVGQCNSDPLAHALRRDLLFDSWRIQRFLGCTD